MEYVILLFITLGITLISSVFSYFARRFHPALVFLPPFILLAFAGYTLLLARQTSDISGLGFFLFSILFAISGLLNLLVATYLYISKKRSF